MSDFDLVTQYVKRVQKVSTVTSLEFETEAAIKELGFDYFAILHHLDRTYPGAPAAQGQVRLSNYPSAWRETIQSERLVSVDPVLLASQRTAVGFLWSELPRLIKLNDKQREILAQAKKRGLSEGYTVPVHIPGECIGSSSFGVSAAHEVRADVIPVLPYFGGFAFEAGRRIAMTRADADAEARVVFTERQLDCIVLAGRGHSAREGAQALGIKQDSFQKYLEAAKLRVGVSTTTELIVRSLFDGHVTFRDLLGEKKTNRLS